MRDADGRTLGTRRLAEVHLVEMCLLYCNLWQLDCIFLK